MTLVQWKKKWREAVTAEQTELSFSDWYASEGKRSWNHSFTIQWSVIGSKYEDWGQCMRHEPGRVLTALWERFLELEANENEFHAAIEGVYSHEEF